MAEEYNPQPGDVVKLMKGEPDKTGYKEMIYTLVDSDGESSESDSTISVRFFKSFIKTHEWSAELVERPKPTPNEGDMYTAEAICSCGCGSGGKVLVFYSKNIAGTHNYRCVDNKGIVVGSYNLNELDDPIKVELVDSHIVTNAQNILDVLQDECTSGEIPFKRFLEQFIDSVNFHKERMKP